jgi:hypothetical protein
MADSRIRWSESTEPEVPPLGRVFMWYDESEKAFKIKKDDGTVETLGSGGGGSTTVVQYFTLDAGQITAASVTLTYNPSPANQTALDIISNGPQYYSDDFTVSGNVLSWAGKPIDGVLSAGDRIRVQYVRT